MADQDFHVPAEHANKTIAAFLRIVLEGQTWTQVRRLITQRRIQINGELWLDDARRLKEGDRITQLGRPAKEPKLLDNIPIRHIDDHVVVVEKPAGVATVRHPSEREWSAERRKLSPTLDDLVSHQLGIEPSRRQRLRIVQRLDKETSGLIVFARTVEAERGLGIQFARHLVLRQYLAVIPGRVESQTIQSMLIRDRGDGRRGSSEHAGKEAITHVTMKEALSGYTIIGCRLETGRTHQIRIHLAELGHPLCGEKVYNRDSRGGVIPDPSGAPRLALHAAELGFQHPVTLESMQWEMPWPPDLREWIEKLRTNRR